MDINKYINSLFVLYNNEDSMVKCQDESKIYFLSFVEFVDNEYQFVGLHIPIKIKLRWEREYPYISYETVGDFLDDNKYKGYNSIKRYIKRINFELNGDEYLREFWYSSPLIVNISQMNSPYEFIHLSDNLEDMKKDYEVLKGL